VGSAFVRSEYDARTCNSNREPEGVAPIDNDGVHVKVASLDDWFDTLRTLPCFERLRDHDVAVFTDHAGNVGVLAERRESFDVLVLIRMRTAIRAPLLERLPNPRLINQRSV
jgi:D-3-phosphoglycerate dehydrogenase